MDSQFTLAGFVYIQYLMDGHAWLQNEGELETTGLV
jgi:hypothetical protein